MEFEAKCYSELDLLEISENSSKVKQIVEKETEGGGGGASDACSLSGREEVQCGGVRQCAGPETSRVEIGGRS